MNQDTRKDKRAKAVSLNVRYKSATVDEFIDNHSHDVSRGGIFVKTPTPFSPGTLLKFEIHLAGHEKVLAGVGRVVWKREPSKATSEKPSGMGVKFIKIDDASRAVIDRLVSEKLDAGRAYTSEKAALDAHDKSEGPSTLPWLSPISSRSSFPPGASTPVGVPAIGAAPRPVRVVAPPRPAAPAAPAAARGAALPPAVAPMKRGSTIIGVAPPSGSSPPPARASQPSIPPLIPPSSPARSSDRPPESPRLGPPPPRPSSGDVRSRSTMLGIGALPRIPSAQSAQTKDFKATEAQAAPSQQGQQVEGAQSMFPESSPESATQSTREPTMMKQAAELLEEALKEAGGSLDEISHNPLFSQSAQPAPAEKADANGDAQNATQNASAEKADEGAGATDAAVESAPAVSSVPSVESLAKSDDTSKEDTESPSPIAAEPVSSVSSAASSAPVKLIDQIQAPPKKGGSFAFVLLAAVIVISGAAYAWQTGFFSKSTGTEPAPPSAPSMEAPPAVPSAPPPSEPPSTDEADGTSASAPASPATPAEANEAGADLDASVDAGTARDASAASAATAAPRVVPARPPHPRRRYVAPKPPPDASVEAPEETPEGADASTEAPHDRHDSADAGGADAGLPKSIETPAPTPYNSVVPPLPTVPPFTKDGDARAPWPADASAPPPHDSVESTHPKPAETPAPARSY